MAKFYDHVTDTNSVILTRALLLGMEFRRINSDIIVVVNAAQGVNGSWTNENGHKAEEIAARAYLRWKGGEPFYYGDYKLEIRARPLREVIDALP